MNVGIELGMKNTRVATCTLFANSRKKYSVLENTSGQHETSSIVLFDDPHMFGNSAQSIMSSNAKRTNYGINELIGKKFSDPDIQNLAKKLPDKIKSDEKDNILIRNDINSKYYYPEEVLSDILGEMKNIVYKKTGKSINNCVISIPSNINESQRSAILKAASNAQIPNPQLVNEQIAAIVAYEYEKNEKFTKTIVINIDNYKTDISIVEKISNQYKIKGYTSIKETGTDFIDDLIVKNVIDNFRKKHNISNSIQINRRSLEELKTRIKKVKFMTQLSNIYILDFYDGNDLQETFYPYLLQNICYHIIKQITGGINSCLNIDDIENYKIIFIGESSGITLLNQAIVDELNSIYISINNPVEAIAVGAAIISDKISNNEPFNVIFELKQNILSNSDSSSSISFIDIEYSHSEHDLEIESQSEDSKSEFCNFSIDIKHNSITQNVINLKSQIPLTQSLTFLTTGDKQKMIETQLVLTLNNKSEYVWNLIIRDLPSKPAGKLSAILTFSITEQNKIVLTAKCNSNNYSGDCRIDLIENSKIDNDYINISNINRKITTIELKN